MGQHCTGFRLVMLSASPMCVKDPLLGLQLVTHQCLWLFA